MLKRFQIPLCAIGLTLGLTLASLPAFAWEDAEVPPSRFTESFEKGLTAYDRGDFKEAYETWLPIAQEGDLAAMRNVGHMLQKGKGVERDVETAARWYSAAAKRGLTGAQINLADLFYHGEGVPQSYAMAAQWYARAARAGNASAQFKLGRMIEDGQVDENNLALARKLYGWAADAGHSGALERVRHLDERSEPLVHGGEQKPEDPLTLELDKNFEGPGEPPYTHDMPYTSEVKDELREARRSFLAGGRGDAVTLWRKLAHAQVPEAQYRLGLALLQGLGTLENHQEARHWLELAANGGHERAAVVLSYLPS